MKTTTPMTTTLFEEWKRKKMMEKEAQLAAKQAERAKNDRMRYCIVIGMNSLIASMQIDMSVYYEDNL